MSRSFNVRDTFGCTVGLYFLIRYVVYCKEYAGIFRKSSRKGYIESEAIIEQTGISSVIEAFRFVAGIEAQIPLTWRP